MHKYLSAAIVSMLAFSVHAEGKWEVGVAGGWGMTKMTETLNQSNNLGDSARYKFKFRGNGPSIGIIAGHYIQKETNIFGFYTSGYYDFYNAQNQGPKNDHSGDVELISKNMLKRKYTIELAGKIGHIINSNILLYGKAGAVHSAFQEQYEDIYANIKDKKNAWGGTIGFGAQKMHETINIGLEYNFQYYQRLGIKTNYTVTGIDIANRPKLRPKYHTVVLTITKIL